MIVGVVIFPGSNCDADLIHAFRDVVGVEAREVWFRDTLPPDVTAVGLPGGFTYGDYLRVGALAKHAPVMRSVIDLAKRGAPVIGICNGFQALTECGLLPGALLKNDCLRFVCKDIHLKVERRAGRFFADAPDVERMPIAHGDGRYFIDDEGLARLEDNGQVALRYCDEEGEAGAAHNPNGSRNNIAGVLNEAGNVLGLMPHPERACEPALGSGGDGLRLLKAMLA